MEKRKALVVDDMTELRAITKLMLTMRGFAVEEACDGAEAPNQLWPRMAKRP